MKFKIGDKVRFLNEKGEGTVSKIINKTTLGITIEEGFEIPFTIPELVLISTEGQEPQPDKKIVPHIPIQVIKQTHVEKSNPAPVKKEREGVFIAFSPDKANNISYSDFNVWLINNTNYQVLFTYSLFQNGSFTTLETGAAKANEFLLIETIDRKKLHDFSTFKVDLLFFDNQAHSPQPPVSELIKLKPIKLYKENAFLANSFIPDKALMMTICHTNDLLQQEAYEPKTDLSKILFQKKIYSETAKRSKPHIHNDPAYEMEIDLHIEELIDNFKGMSNAEIVLVQLKHFQHTLDTAINNHYRKLIVIHGVGNGRLKQEVRNILSSYKNLQYYDASYSKYGFGATEIVIH